MIIRITDTIDDRDRVFLLNVDDIGCVTVVGEATCIQFISRPDDILSVGISPDDIMDRIAREKRSICSDASMSRGQTIDNMLGTTVDDIRHPYE